MNKVMILSREIEPIRRLLTFFESVSDFSVEGYYDNEADLLSALHKTPIDALFVSSPFITKEKLYPLISTNKLRPLIVLMSRTGSDALKGYEYHNVVDYITEFHNDQRMHLCLSKVRHILGLIDSLNDTPRITTEQIFVKVDKKMIRLALSDIYYIESVKDYIKIVTSQKSYLVYNTLTNFTASLPQDRFVRIHRSYTVSVDKVDALKGNVVEILNIKIPFTRKYLAENKSKLIK